MSRWLWWKWTLVIGLLRLSALAARVLFRVPKGRLGGPQGPTSLPGADQGQRLAELDAARERYAVEDVGPRLGLSIPWAHRTLRRLPLEERYGPAMLPAKTLLKLALQVNLDGARRWASIDELRSVYRPLGMPDSAAWWSDDAAFSRLRVAGPNPLWIRGRSRSRI